MLLLDFLLKIILLILGIDVAILIFASVALLYAKIHETIVKTTILKRDNINEKKDNRTL
jgi:hypothetical protein